MRRIAAVFEQLKSKGRPALISFIMGGDPSFKDCENILLGLPAAGADIIEIGMPFSDPMADGPVIQLAGQRAIAGGTTIKQILEIITSFRKLNNTTPIILMGYANPIYSYDVDRFCNDAAEAGVDGLIVVDLPPEEDEKLRNAAANQFLDVIRLVTPTTTDSRLDVILNGATGFLYYVSITGVTGAAKANLERISPHIQEIKKRSSLPLVVGFGIKTANDAQEMSKLGDGVVVGSSIVEKVAMLQVVAGDTDRDQNDYSVVFDHVRDLSQSLNLSKAS